MRQRDIFLRLLICGALMQMLYAKGACAQSPLINGGFEELDEQGQPVGWKAIGAFLPAALTTEKPYRGQHALRLVGDGEAHAFRQELPAVPTRIYRASAFFRAQKVQFGPEDFARFYFHIHYRGRPYTDTSQIYVDVPGGSYDWRRISVRLVPQTQWPIEKIWVTIVGQFRSGTLDCDEVIWEEGGFSTGALALEWQKGAQPIMISDMSHCQPAAAVSLQARRKKWRLIPYEAGQIAGKLIWASFESQAPELTLPLNVQGWHAIYVGLADPAHLGCQALLRLSADPAPVPRVRTAGDLEEAFFKVADLTGQSLHISRHPRGPGCGIAYVKLVPLTSEEVAAWQARFQKETHKRLVTTIDGFSFIYERRCVTKEDLWREIEVYRDTDFGTLILQMGGADMTNYPSLVGERRGQDLEVFDRAGDRHYAEAIGELARKGINPTRVLMEGAHALGMKVHVAIRPGAWEHSPPLDSFFTSRFYRQNPQWRCVDRDGTPVARMSLAVPQVRAHLIAVLREAVSFGADGACVLYVRGAPYVLYEKPFADLFQARYGKDVRSVPENDPQILALRTEIITTFMREIRAMLDDEGQRRGVRLQLSAMIMANEADNKRFGIDVRQWIDQKLVDLLMPYLHAGGSSAKEYDMAFFKSVCGPANVPVKPTFIGWNTPDLTLLLQKAVALYEQGAEGLTIWDANSGDDRTDRWSVLRRLGNPQDARALLQDGLPPPVTLRFHRLADFIMDGPYHPNWGY